MSDPAATSPDSGFTLIEVLLALALTSLVVALASNAFQSLSRGAERGESAAARIETMSRGLGALRHDLQRIEHVARLEGPADKPDASLVFSGAKQGLSFVRIEPGHLSEPGSFLISYRVRSDRSGISRLVRTRVPYDATGRAPRGTANESDEVVVLEGAYEMSFAYLGDAATTRQGRADWRDSWAERARMPTLIRLALKPNTVAIPDMPALIVRPVITMQSICLGEDKAACVAPKTDTAARAPSPKKQAP